MTPNDVASTDDRKRVQDFVCAVLRACRIHGFSLRSPDPGAAIEIVPFDEYDDDELLDANVDAVVTPPTLPVSAIDHPPKAAWQALDEYEMREAADAVVRRLDAEDRTFTP